MKKTLILGGNGYTGSVIKKYLDNIFDVDVYGSRSDDYNKLDKEYINSFEYVILLAGHSSVQRCDGPLLPVWNNNVRNFHNLLQKMTPEQKLIYASSASVYGNSDYDGEYTESYTNYEYVNNYDLTKISLDMLAKNYISEGRNIVGFRFGTVNGESDVLRIDLMINAMVHTAINQGVINVTNKHVNRPILGTNDLSRAMKQTIIANDFVPGIYNLTSFNSNVDAISKTISNVLGTQIIDNGNTITYNFKMSNSKFSDVYKFKFEDTVDTITENVIECLNNKNTVVVKRNEYFDYKG